MIFFFSCENKRGVQRVEGIEEDIPTVKVPRFNADSAFSFIQRQVDFGPRVPNTPEHQATRKYLVTTLENYGAKVVEQSFEATAYDGEVLQLTNVFASFSPEKEKRILLAAHWDTRKIADKDTERVFEPIDGANDGGSGVGVLLEIARVLHSAKGLPGVGVDIILFDGEDNGPPDFEQRTRNSELAWCLGSQHWSKYKHEKNYSAYYGILLDMVGAAGARFYKEGYSQEYAPSVVQKVWKAATELGFSDFFINEKGAHITDDHKFVNEIAKIPMIDIVDFDMESEKLFREYHHTHADNMDIIDKNTLRAVGQTVLHVIYHER